MKTSLAVYLGAALFALPLLSFAVEANAPFLLAGVSDRGDSLELHFDAPYSKAAWLVIKGDRSGFPTKTIPCSYEIEHVRKSGVLENPVVRITFNDKQTMTIACDPLSDNCHADGYPTVSGTSFSMLWRIKRVDSPSVQAKSPARQ